MAQTSLPKGWIHAIINGEVVPVEMLFCEECKLWHVDKDHVMKHIEAVEPDIKREDVKIAGLLTY